MLGGNNTLSDCTLFQRNYVSEDHALEKIAYKYIFIDINYLVLIENDKRISDLRIRSHQRPSNFKTDYLIFFDTIKIK